MSVAVTYQDAFFEVGVGVTVEDGSPEIGGRLAASCQRLLPPLHEPARPHSQWGETRGLTGPSN